MTVRMRHTRAHTKNRRSHHALSAPAVSNEAKDGVHLRHRVSPITGKYKGEQVLDFSKKEMKKSERAAKKAETKTESKSEKAEAKEAKKENKKTETKTEEKTEVAKDSTNEVTAEKVAEKTDSEK